MQNEGESFEVLAPAVGAMVSAVAIVLAEPPIDTWWLAPFVLVPWLVSERSPRTLVVSGFLAGTLSGLGMGYWIHTGLRNIGASPIEAASGLLLAAVWVTGAPGALYGVVASWARRAPGWAGSLLFAACVGGIDWLRGLSALWLPWSLLGHSQAMAHGPAQLAVVGGVPLVSALLAGVSFAVAHALRARGGSRIRWSWLPWAGAYLALVVLGVPVAETLRERDEDTGSALQVLLVQPRIPPGDRWSPTLQRTNVVLLGRRTLAAIEETGARPDIVFWPETSVTTPLEDAPKVAEELGRWTSRFGAPLVFGAVSPGTTDSLYRNSALWMSAEGRVLDRFDKTLAVPFVEGQPATKLAGFLQRIVGAASLPRLVEVGEEERSLRGEVALAIALCFEVVYPDLVARRVERDTTAIVNLANDAWYGSPTPGRQQLAFATFRAIEHRRYLLRVADSGPSAVVDPFGRIVRQLGPRETGYLAAEIEGSEGPRRIEQIGVLAVVLLGAGLGLVASSLLSRRQKR